MSQRVMSSPEMVATLRDVAPGTILLVVYDKPARRTEPRTEAARRREAALAKARAAGLPENIYIGAFLGMAANARSQVCFSLLAMNRGPVGSEGELRTFNPATGDLRSIFVLPAVALTSQHGTRAA